MRARSFWSSEAIDWASVMARRSSFSSDEELRANLGSMESMLPARGQRCSARVPAWRPYQSEGGGRDANFSGEIYAGLGERSRARSRSGKPLAICPAWRAPDAPALRKRP